MNIRRANPSPRAVLTLGLLALTPLTTRATTLIGVGAGPAGSSIDGAGGRTNIDRLQYRHLPAGTYSIDDFSFHGVSINGTVQPFLSTEASGIFTPIWAGGVGGAVLGANTVTYTPGSQQFTLSAPTKIYSGFTMTADAVGFAGGGTTAHHGSVLTPTVGSPMPAFGHPTLGRTYSTGLSVTGLTTVTSAQLGAGADIANASAQDTPGQDRLNVELLFANFAPGTYRVSDWELNVLDHTQSGTITPMLLTRTGTAYTTLWIGDALDPSANGAQSYALDATITLSVATEVYAGFFTQGGGSGIIALDGANTGGNASGADHDNSFTAPASIGEDLGAFSNPGLHRTYAFAINVLPIPEPAGITLLALAGIAHLFRRRRGAAA